MMMERGISVSGRCAHHYPIMVVLPGEVRRLTLNRPGRGAKATVLPIGFRGGSLHVVAPHTDSCE